MSSGAPRFHAAVSPHLDAGCHGHPGRPAGEDRPPAWSWARAVRRPGPCRQALLRVLGGDTRMCLAQSSARSPAGRSQSHRHLSPAPCRALCAALLCPRSQAWAGHVPARGAQPGEAVASAPPPALLLGLGRKIHKILKTPNSKSSFPPRKTKPALPNLQLLAPEAAALLVGGQGASRKWVLLPQEGAWGRSPRRWVRSFGGCPHSSCSV